MAKQSEKTKMRWVALGVSAILVLLDQALKHWAITVLAQSGPQNVIPGFFSFTYVENRGAAFGLFQDRTMILAILTGIALLVLFLALLLGYVRGSYLIWSLALVLAGGVGNLIDRVARGFVVDYFDFSALFGFPVFNFADCCVVVGTILIIGYLFWEDSHSKRDSSSTKHSEMDAG